SDLLAACSVAIEATAAKTMIPFFHMQVPDGTSMNSIRNSCAARRNFTPLLCAHFIAYFGEPGEVANPKSIGGPLGQLYFTDFLSRAKNGKPRPVRRHLADREINHDDLRLRVDARHVADGGTGRDQKVCLSRACPRRNRRVGFRGPPKTASR